MGRVRGEAGVTPVGRSRDSFGKLRGEIVVCRLCPRLVAWREKVAREKVARFRDREYWGRPLPGFGDPAARLLVVGLAPAAHGGNRTGRVFTGDKSGDWLFRALHRAGFANQPASTSIDDGLELRSAWVTAAVKCAPPGNKPTPRETSSCRPYMEREVRLLRRLRVAVALGRFAFDACLQVLGQGELPRPKPVFAHGAVHGLPDGIQVVCSYHPSQRNTSTGLLKEGAFDAVFTTARRLMG
ncbi:MAG: uracil-DNA glycosylase [Deltaproteobacteria bacterium]|nr:uracil-DNA glycosylase [Deltaproteobacteria bacterium]